MRASPWIALCALAALSACAAGGGPELEEYMPLQASAPLTYAVEERNEYRPSNRDPWVAQIRGSQVEAYRPATSQEIERFGGGASSLVAKTSRRTDGDSGAVEEITLFFSRGDAGLLLHGSHDGYGLQELYEPPLKVAPDRLPAGSRWEMGALRQRGMVFPTAGEVLGVEDVATEAGVWRGCLHLAYRVENASGGVGEGAGALALTSGSSRIQRWYAPGVGLVKETSDTALSGAGGDGSTLDISATRTVLLQATPPS